MIIPYLDFLKTLPGGDLTAFIILLCVFAISFEVLLVAILKILQFLVGKTKTTLDDRVLKAISKYLPFIATITSLWLALEVVYPDLITFGKLTEFDLYLILILAVVGLMLSSIADAFLIWYGLEIRKTQEKKINENEVFPFVRNVVKIAIILIFVVFILQRLGFDTTAIITGLGVGGLAVALALQDTLSNFFGGVHILVDKPFKEEDYIKLENGVGGTVKQIGWRTTRIETFSSNNIVVIPNSKLSGSILENYSAPNEKTGITYIIGVDYKEDVEDVEKILLEALQSAALKSTLIDRDSIWVRFEAFGDYALNFRLGYLINGYINKGLALRETNKEIFYAFKKNNISIPFPIRTIYNAKVK